MTGRIHSFNKFKEKQTHILAGVAVIIEGRLLIVKPTKYRKFNNKWSIPKGHSETSDSLRDALHELKEETGVVPLTDPISDFKITYIKGGVKKYLTIYIFNENKSILTGLLYKNTWEIKEKFYDRIEIGSAQFVPLQKARLKLEVHLNPIIDELNKFNL